MKRMLWLMLAAFSVSALAGESGTALKNDTLRKEPYSDAAAAGNLKRDDKVDILEKKGAWLKVKTPGGSGWVRMLSVKRGQAAKTGSSGLQGLATGRAGTGQVVSTTGIRGLNEEELKAAKFSESEIKLMEGNTISADTAKQFAGTAGLQARQLNYLPAPTGDAPTTEQPTSQGFPR